MKKTGEKNPKQLRRKLYSALSMLLVATILMATTSYAWLVLSVAPEVTGISTQVGANGALEIALLTTETWGNPNLIRTTVGDSLKTRDPAANQFWGNLVDLSYADYGLNSVMLMPSRLKVIASEDANSVGSNLLSVPTYGYDGRIIEVEDNTLGATFKSGEFSLIPGASDYGVRAIGTADTLSAQESALALAKSNITAYTNSANSEASAILNNNGDALINIVITHFMESSSTYCDSELDVLKGLLEGLQGVLDYVDLSVRHGMVALAASTISSKETFTQVRDRVMDTNKSLDQLMSELDEIGEIPSAFMTWVTRLTEIQNSLNAAKNTANNMSGGSYTWEQFRSIMDYIMKMDGVYLGDKKLSEFSASDAGSLIGGDNKLSLAPGSGIFADLAEFIGNYSVTVNYMGAIEITTVYAGDPHLSVLAELVKNLKAAGNDGSSQEAVALTATYGYALDLAFRCNAADADLLLQTVPTNRVYEESVAGATMGGGSYMEFTTKDSSFSTAKMIELMDAIRVAFVDNQNKILGIAKLNTSNRIIVDDVIEAPLYLYDYQLSEEDGALLMGERRLVDNVITLLNQNEPKAVTAVVWLDGDIVDNTMVSATESASLSGVLNLQFATSANLIPAANSDLMNATADKEELGNLLSDYKSIMDAGQKTYTTISWDDFTSAYRYANAVYNNPNANDNQVYIAAQSLILSGRGLADVSHNAIDTKISEIRAEVGTSSDVARYVIKNSDESYAAVGHEEHTQKVHDGWTIVGEVYQVDYSNNLHDEGNGIHTQIYTDASWSSMASALYHAEATAMNPNATDEQLNAALTALETAHESLQRRVFFKAYDYNGRLYYEAICNANDADTYGKWYDSDFKRIVSDIMILNLDAYAEPAEIAQIEQDEAVAWNSGKITPTVKLLDKAYTELQAEEILGTNWNNFDEEYFMELMEQRHSTTLSSLISIIEDEELNIDTTAAHNMVDSKTDVSAASARTEIKRLNDLVTRALAQKQSDEEAAKTDMTPSQRILLTTAVNTAESVENYGDPSKIEDADLRQKVEALKTKVAEVNTLLANTNATKVAADAALQNINSALTAAGKEAVTEYNTLTHSLPVTSEVFDVVYDVEYPGVTLKLTGKTNETKFSAVILTKNGVLFTAEKTVSIYTPADSVEFVGNDVTVTEDTYNLSLAKDNSGAITAGLKYDLGKRDQREIELGNITADGVVSVGEKAKYWTWASEDTNTVTVSEGSNGKCTITAKAAGTTYVTVTVETENGNTYVGRIAVTVN